MPPFTRSVRFDGTAHARGLPEAADYVLRRLAEQTGGRAFFPVGDVELRSVYEDIRTELSNQYLLVYQTDAQRADERFRSVAVLIDGRRAIARTKRGYFALPQ